jgi:hypothetical protein
VGAEADPVFEPPVRTDELDPTIRARRVEWDAALQPMNAHWSEHAEARIRSCQDVVDRLAEYHARVVDHTDVDLSAPTRWVAILESTGRCIGLADALIDQIRRGYASETAGRRAFYTRHSISPSPSQEATKVKRSDGWAASSTRRSARKQNARRSLQGSWPTHRHWQRSTRKSPNASLWPSEPWACQWATRLTAFTRTRGECTATSRIACTIGEGCLRTRSSSN